MRINQRCAAIGGRGGAGGKVFSFVFPLTQSKPKLLLLL